MARPPLPIGTWGTITTTKVESGRYRSLTRLRDPDGTTRRVTAVGTSKAAAERALRDVLSQRTAPVAGLLTADTRLVELADLWITGLETEGRIEQTTINEYRRVLKTLVLPRVGGLRLSEATTGRIDRLLLTLRAQSPNRQRKAKVVLGAMLDIAVRHDALTVNPVRATSRVHTPKKETKALSVADLVEIRAAVHRWLNADRPGPKASADMADVIDMMLATGCRIGEVLALRWADLELDREVPTLTVSGTIKTEKGKGTYRKSTPKTDSSRRTVALPAFAVDLLRERREFATTNDLDAVFATRNGTWHQVVNIERRWRQIRKDTGFEWVTPHTFRKTVATLISEASTSELASRQLGHSSSQITRDHYIAKPAVAADLSELLQSLAAPDQEPS